jgi:hypothetical protein
MGGHGAQKYYCFIGLYFARSKYFWRALLRSKRWYDGAQGLWFFCFKDKRKSATYVSVLSVDGRVNLYSATASDGGPVAKVWPL